MLRLLHMQAISAPPAIAGLVTALALLTGMPATAGVTGPVFADSTAQCPSSGLCVLETRSRHAFPARTSHQLLAAIEGDPDAPRVEAHASAQFGLVLSFELRPGQGGCRLDRIAVRLHADLRLPRFVEAVRASAELRDRLRALDEGLMRHERGHVAIAVEHAEELLATLSAVGPAPTCAAARRQAGRAHLRQSMRHELAQQLYESRTAFGAGQGAIFRRLAP